MTVQFNGLKVEITETNFEMDHGVEVLSAHFIDSGKELSESELDQIQEQFQSELYQEAYVDRASSAYDRAKDLRKYGE